jgi:nicotinamide-nucleotide amidase
MKVEIISIGAELLLNDVLDTNAAYISRSLQELNAELIFKVTVGDNLERITEAMRIALARADLVLTTGGLGNGPFDFTRQAAAAATQSWLDPVTQIIEGSVLIGETASQPTHYSGFMIENHTGLLVCLPGNRREMAYLLETDLFPRIKARTNVQSGLLILRTAGLAESSLREQLADLRFTAAQHLSFDSYAGQTTIRLRAAADTEAAIQSQLQEMRAAIIARLGDNVYGQGQDRLEGVILTMLAGSQCRVAIAECHTNRMLSRLLEHEPGIEKTAVLLPFQTDVELAAALGLAPRESNAGLTGWCRLVAETLLQQMDTDLALLVYNHTMPGGVQLNVYLASPHGVSVTQRSFGGHPDHIHQWACTLGLTHLYRWLIAHA